MHYEHLPTELIAHIFTSTASVSDALTLSSTCRRYREIFNRQKVTILAAAAEHQYGPLHDAVQLLTHNASQPAHLVRTVPISFSLIKQIVDIGRVAEKWADLYPFKRWKADFESRRLLTSYEQYRIRRALYRLWLYGEAFHNRQHTRETRQIKLVVQERSRLLHNWSTEELVEMADVRQVMRDVVGDNMCPSNGTIARKWRKRFPEDTTPHPLMFNIHLNYPPPATAMNPAFQPSGYHNPYNNHRPSRSTYSWSKYQSTPAHDPGAEGWGDAIQHYYVVEDMLKLSPSQILFLKENVKYKRDVESWIRWFAAAGCGDWGWFDNNGETWGETLRLVLAERGLEVANVLGEDGTGFDGDWGVVREEE
ncbi:hypothetical protein NA57DRAFT_44805 [Rhizodiscina lignyota]|uniref:F-box domain-containing protein n=1 Tax=Rhizodiscina lignyota TaxID=1504668 RepID=A0A9P4I726_9PEZI|nr:hypothetical protein NA57DRAFT_44805 [Rhizodiscina lignyota]